MIQLDKTINPHKETNIGLAGANSDEADSAMILLHGRGADAESMRSLIPEIYNDGMIYIMPQATNNTWYPYRFIEKRESNEPGITSALVLIDSIVNTLIRNKISRENIYLLGFSQGACLAADYAARYPGRFGGVFVLSGGLIGETISEADYHGDLQQTPVFFGCSYNDFHIPEQRIHESAKTFTNLNALVTKKIYPDMGHTINQDELDVIRQVISTKLFV